MSTTSIAHRLHKGHGKVAVRKGGLSPFKAAEWDAHLKLDNLFGGFPLALGWAEEELLPAAFSPRVDVSETAKEVRVSAELPGMEEKDITVEMGDEAMAIRGERREDREEKGKNWTRREQSYGFFDRVIPLPANVDADKANAKFSKGILTVTVPKMEERKGTRRTVKIHNA